MNLQHNSDGLIYDADIPADSDGQTHNVVCAAPPDLAALFAAAPELLEACKLALLAIPSKADGELGKMIRLARRKITAAIKKAECNE